VLGPPTPIPPAGPIAPGGPNAESKFILNGQICLSNLFSHIYSSNCSSPFTVPVDIAFLVDASKEVTEINFRLEVKFVSSVVQSFLVSKKGIHVGFAIISGDGLLITDFNSNTDTASFVSAIGKTPYPGESRQAGKGIVLVKDNLFGTSGRKEATKVSQ
jgi:hypothetical protein